MAKSNLCHIYQSDMCGPDSANAAIILLAWWGKFLLLKSKLQLSLKDLRNNMPSGLLEWTVAPLRSSDDIREDTHAIYSCNWNSKM